MKHLGILLVCFVIIVFSCTEEDNIVQIDTYPLPAEINPAIAARLTERHETDSYIFYYAPGDTVEFDRCEAYVRWGMDYLGVSLPKKIEYFKFRSFQEMGEALPSPAGGWAFPDYVAYATMWRWHNHECMHVLTYWWANESYSPAFFMEGMAVAHEYDPYNDDWISRWNRGDVREPWLDITKRLNSEGKLYPLAGILASQSFWYNVGNEVERIAYPQAGMFIKYLIEKYGIDKTREIYTALDYDDSLETIKAHFNTIFGVDIRKAEQDWLIWLSDNN
jgi:hypothetical protein